MGGFPSWPSFWNTLYRAGRDHCNADMMSRLPDMGELCRGYRVGVKIEVTMWGCNFCVRKQDKFEKEVDDVVPLVVRDNFISLNILVTKKW